MSRRPRATTAWLVTASMTFGAVAAGTTGAASDGGSTDGGTVSSASDPTDGVKIIEQSAPFSSTDQLWGGDGADVVSYGLFDEQFGDSATWGRTFRECLGVDGLGRVCANGGAEAEVSIAGSTSMSFEFDGIEGGSIDVTYPVTVTFTAPADNSFDPGDVVRIGTSVAVDAAAAEISVSFPEFEAFRITPTFALDGTASYRLCFIDCVSGSTGSSGSAATMGIEFADGEFRLEDDVVDFAGGCFDGEDFLAVAIALGLTEYPNDRCDNKGYLFDPDVELTTTVTEHGALRAEGHDRFSVFPVSLMTWALRATPLPIWAIANLDPVSYRGAGISWTSVNVIATALTSVHQEIDFDPTVEIDLDWGHDLGFRIGTDGDWDRGQYATLIAGEDLYLETRADLSSIVDLNPRVRLTDADVVDDSTMSTTGNLEVSALGFSFETPRWRECLGSGELEVCATLIPSTKESFGPLLDDNTPIGQEDEVVLFRGTYPVGELEGMEFELEPFDIVPRPRVEIRSALRPVNGPGTFDLLLDDDVVEAGVADGGTSGMIVVEPGTHSISVANGHDGDLVYYDTHITCVHRADENDHHTDRSQVRTATVAKATDEFTIDLTGGEDLICTVLVRLPVPFECDAMSFDHVILGDPYSDTSEILRGTTENDIIVGYGGDDLIVALGGDDCAAGGEGNDRIILGPGSSVAGTGPGDNHVVGGAGDLIHVGPGTNRINATGATIVHTSSD